MNEVDEIESVGSDEDPAEDEFSQKEIQQLLPGRTRTKTKKKKKVQPKLRELKTPVREKVTA